MKSKIAIAAAAALGTLALATSPVARAGDQFNQDAWLMQQLQISDGYAPPVSANFAPSFGRNAAGQNVSAEARAQSEWLTRQLQISDGYLPPDDSFAEKKTVAYEPASPAERAQSEWLAQELQVTDGYAPPLAARADDRSETMTSTYDGGVSRHN